MKYIWTPWRLKYIQSQKIGTECVFCQLLSQPDASTSLIVYRGELTFVILNKFPYNSGHVMVVPVRHHPTLEELPKETRDEIMELTAKSTAVLKKVYRPEGFNIGMNIGEIAGAGIAHHIHMHVVPRWAGDTSYISILGDTRVLPETLEDSYSKLLKAWKEL